MNYEVYEIYSRESEKHFQFTTSNQITYLLKLSKAEFRFQTTCLSCSDIEEVAFAPIGENTKSNDANISYTIINFLKKYIEIYSCPLIFICDSLDNKEKYRLELFNRWFVKGGSSEHYKYATREYQFDSQTLYFGILAKQSDTNFEQYLDELDLTFY